ncbi:hypothetical protein ACKKBF_B01985 [Auxenochlorella protothecoides x Auxenochlorella symbiontica]
MSSGYTALPSLTSPDGASTAPPLPNGFDDPSHPGVRERVARWWKDSVGWGSPPRPPPPPSNYLTLIPLSDARLQPRDTRLTVVFLLGFALAIAGAVFITVPRGVSIGEVCVRPSRMSWNTTKSTYQLKLLAMVPVYNPNYLKAHIEGELRVLFYNTEAGKQSMGSVKLPARSSPAIIDVTIDASDVPSDYILAILSQCSTFPEVLIFFLQGNLTARYLFQRQHLTAIDTYFLIDCRNGGGMQPDDVPPSATPAPLALDRLRGLDPGWC